MPVDPSAIIVKIGGAFLTQFARVGRVRIDDLLNDTPNTAALTLVFAQRVGPPSSGAFLDTAFDSTAFQTAFQASTILKPPPVNVGAPIAMYLGEVSPSTQIFGGQIMTREQYAEFDKPEHVRFDLTCVDFTRRLNHRKVTREYAAQSATAIVLDVIARYAPGITTEHVQAGLGSLDGGITFTFEEVSRALSRIAEKIGAYWYLDYVGDLHFFTGTEPGPPPAALVPGGDFANFKISADLSQVRTRVIVEGDGATVLLSLDAGKGVGIKPISQTSPFNPAGGRAKIGPDLVTYTGVYSGGAKTNTVGVGSGGTPPPAAPWAPVATPAGPGVIGGLAGGPYVYAVTFETVDGSRSTLGASSAPVSIAPASNPPATICGYPSIPARGPIAYGVASVYATSFVDASGRETVATQGGNPISARAVANPDAPPVLQAANLSGAMAPGTYHYRQTFLTAAGETLTGNPLQVGIVPGTGGARILLQTRPDGVATTGDGRIVGRRLYRCSVDLTEPWRHVVDVPNNTSGVTVDDTRSDAQLPARQLPQFSTATDSEAAVVTVPTSIDARIVRRRLYRKDGAGESRLIAEIPDNATTTFNDVAVAPGGNLAPTVNAITTGAIGVSGIAIGPAGTARRRVFRTTAGGSEFRELASLENNTVTTLTDATPDANLGGSPLPPQGGGDASSAPPTAIGAPEMRVASVAGFPAIGWVAVESQVIFYGSAGTVGGAPFLQGIPTSGPGSITAEIPAGTVVTAAPALVGVSPDTKITAGDAVQLIVQVDDVPAQQAIAAIEGGDGVIEHYIQDRRLSEAGALARGRADLALFKTVELRLSYTTRDPETRSGRTVHVDLPAPTNVAGDFLIQRVTIDDVSFAKNHMPRRAVDASTTRFSFDDVLARILLEQA